MSESSEFLRFLSSAIGEYVKKTDFLNFIYSADYLINLTDRI